MIKFDDDYLQNLLTLVRSNFDRDGSLLPVLMTNGQQGVKMIGLSVSNNQWHLVRDQMSHNLLVLIENKEIFEFIFIVECWVAGAESVSHLRTHGTLAEYPDRKEIVIVIHSSTEREVRYFADIIRPETGKPTLDKWDKSVISMKEATVDALANTRFGGLWHRSQQKTN